MKKKLITTIKNEKLPLDVCRYLDGAYYKIGNIDVKDSGDCYLINGKFYREETGKIVYDFRINQYVLRNMNIIKGVVGFENNNPILGEFSLSGNEVIINTPTERLYLLNENLLENNKEYREKISDGEFYHISLLSAKEFITKEFPSEEYKTSLPYDSKGISDSFISQYENLDLKINPKLDQYAEALKGLSFGFEFETTKGFLPERILKNTGLIPLRDGSISGIEYVTVPMTGGKGLHVLMNAVQELNKRTEFDNSCALHLHLGNIPRTKEFILAFFLVTLKFQEEIFSLFPLYKKYNFEVKRKNYSKPYDLYYFLSRLDDSINQNNINKNFKVLFDYLSQGYSVFEEYKSDLNNVENHPADKEGNQKWNIKHRYHFHNFIPLIYGNKKTVEFRIHTPTYDVNKILGFLYLNSFLVNFTLTNEREILKNPGKFLETFKNLSYLINYQADHYIGNSFIRSNLKDFLTSSISYRKDYVYKFSCEGNIVGNESKCKASSRIKWFDFLKETQFGVIGEEELRKMFAEKESEIMTLYHKGQLNSDSASKSLKEIKIKFSEFKMKIANGEVLKEEHLIDW